MKRIIGLLLALACSPALASYLESAAIPFAQRNVTIFGDSISHGAFAIDLRKNLWVRILQNRIAHSDSYGFVPLVSIGTGEKLSTDVASIRWVGEWLPNQPDSIFSSASPSGFSTRSQSKASGVSITIPSFQSGIRLNWIQSPVGGAFRVHVDGVVVGEVDTSGVLSWASRSFSFGKPSGSTRSIYIEVLDDRPVDLVGPEYLGYKVGPAINNYSQSGRALANVSREAIAQAMTQSSVMIMALGHNDQRQADESDYYFARYRQRIDWLIAGARAHGVRIVVPDFCWTVPATSRTRGELRRLAAETGGVYIDLPSKLSQNDRAVTAEHLMHELGMWWDPSHPNIAGHRWIAEVVGSSLGPVIGQNLLHPTDIQDQRGYASGSHKFR